MVLLFLQYIGFLLVGPGFLHVAYAAETEAPSFLASSALASPAAPSPSAVPKLDVLILCATTESILITLKFLTETNFLNGRDPVLNLTDDEKQELLHIRYGARQDEYLRTRVLHNAATMDDRENDKTGGTTNSPAPPDLDYFFVGNEIDFSRPEFSKLTLKQGRFCNDGIALGEDVDKCFASQKFDAIVDEHCPSKLLMKTKVDKPGGVLQNWQSATVGRRWQRKIWLERNGYASVHDAFEFGGWSLDLIDENAAPWTDTGGWLLFDFQTVLMFFTGWRDQIDGHGPDFEDVDEREREAKLLEQFGRGRFCLLQHIVSEFQFSSIQSPAAALAALPEVVRRKDPARFSDVVLITRSCRRFSYTNHALYFLH